MVGGCGTSLPDARSNAGALFKLVVCRCEAGADLANTVNDAAGEREQPRKSIEPKVASTESSVIPFSDVGCSI